tara:strand:- start:1317 stop:1691 length:375 start_codon:yes stop_codon:yes gene_type:complete
MTPRMEMAIEAWGNVPDWVSALVDACDAKGASQNKVAKRLGFSAPVVSQVLRREYPGNMGNVEKRVRAIYTPGTITCPALGPIGSEDCLNWQDNAKALITANPIKVRMYRACRKCPRYIGEDQS